MKLSRVAALAALALIVVGVFVATGFTEPQIERDRRQVLHAMFREGNFKDAYQGFRELVLDKNSDPKQLGHDLTFAIQALQRLNRTSEIDEFREAAVARRPDNWRLLVAAARSYLWVDHRGTLIGGELQRGHHRGGEMVSAQQRDRVRALQLMQQALPLVKGEPGSEASSFYLALANILLNSHGHQQAWRLQALTDLETLPDYEQGWGYYHHEASGAPVTAEGTPVYYTVPESWEAAASDGQRWRWALAQAAEVNPAILDQARLQLADFLRSQFGVRTLASYGRLFATPAEEDAEKNKSGVYALHTLGEDETIAKLATGVRRFQLPDEFNFIKIYRQIAESEQSGLADNALQRLAEIFEDRRQYPKAAEIWRKSIKEHGKSESKHRRLEQIVGNWGRFEPIVTQPAGKGATTEFRFRNAKSVTFEAHAIQEQKLLDDIKKFIRSGPPKLDWKKIDIGNLGYRLVHRNQAQYLGKRVAQWEVKLDPAANHFDRRTTITTPLTRPGAYLLTAKVAGGNTSKIVIWLADTAIVKKPLREHSFYYVADAVSGKPVAGAELHFFGFKPEHLEGNRYRVHVRERAEKTNADGQLKFPASDDNNEFQWLVTARTAQGRFAFLGYTRVWQAYHGGHGYHAQKVFTITDRPVYRPGQPVNYKFWVRQAKYDQHDESLFAHKTFQIEIYDPKGDKIVNKQATSDAYGGIDGQFDLPQDATLGVYRLHVAGYGGGSFRVEEYKKPEFEVTVQAPEKPVRLGEKINATIEAKYYFGSPVVDAKVSYKVLRSEYNGRWYPAARWDWLYGRGYWWFAYDYAWYPGWQRWGCLRPSPWWWPQSHTPPEVVAQREVPIGPDGTVKIEIDTALAKAVHPDQDHRYEIVAEVVDASRRTIVGQGEVLVARKPFEVCVWTDRGYHRVGEVVSAQFAARTLDGQPVEGRGEAVLLAIDYEEGKPRETKIAAWPVNPNPDGLAQLQIKASKAGQYRLKYTLTDAAGHVGEGAQLFTIIGEGFDGAEFQFNEIELVPEKREYAPGETLKLQVNTDQIGSTVLLFVRTAEGVYPEPQLVRLRGKSTLVEIPIKQQDMPNFFVEAVTVGQAQVYSTAREIYVPPEQRVIGVEVVPSAHAYKPGQPAKVKVKLTDPQGKPYVGSLVLAIYDKSLEYISGGSNVPEIKEFFWKWRRRYREASESNLGRYSPNLALPNKPTMDDIGAFGATVADREQEQVGQDQDSLRRRENRLAKGKMALADGMAMAEFAAAPAMARLDAAGPPSASGGEAAAPLVEPTVRTQFADTALWKASLTSNSDGLAEVELTMPENLTAWKVKAWGMGHGTKVGQGEAEVVTRKNLLVRLQAPRFFVQKDEVVLSANVHNYLSTAKEARVVLELEGDTLSPLGEQTETVEIAAGGETRVDWRVKVLREGQAVVRMKALTDEESDAMEMRFPVYVHGMLKTESFSGSLRPEASSGTITVHVPSERRPEQSRLEVRYSPTLAGAMVDALPYLIDYPYGCTEQTLNRFLPAVITQNVLLDMNLDLEAIQQNRTNLNAQEIGDAQQRAEGWKRFGRNPVFDKEELNEVVKTGVTRLGTMQLSDGGWGWFSGYGEQSYPHTTAVVVHGLQIAQQNDVPLLPDMLERGVAWLAAYQDRQLKSLRLAEKDQKDKHIDKCRADNIDALVYMVLTDAGAQGAAMDDMQRYLHRDRLRLSAYGMAVYGMALAKQNDQQKLAIVMENLGQYLVEDNENQTAYLNLGGDWWYWYGDEIEAQAYYLKLLVRTDPKSPVVPKLVKYLLNNRKHATYWKSTRDTALVIEAFADYLQATEEHQPDLVVEVWMDGEKQKEVAINAENLFSFDNAFLLEGEAVQDGVHTIELRKRGEGPLYYNAYLTNFTLEDPITAAGLEIKVERRYYRLKPAEKTIEVAGSRGQVVDQKVETYQRERLPNLATLQSGELVEIELIIESKNDYEYLLFEDMKAAGFEPVEVQSGYSRNGLGAYVEYRDNRVALFVRQLPRGKHSLTYRVRAEIPGQFSALPTRASAMYAPELKANSDELKLKIVDAK